MKGFTHIRMALLFGMIFSIQIPAASSARKIYFDPLNGDNRNPGISSATARKSLEEPGQGPAHDFLQRMESRVSARAASDLLRIVLGPEILNGWDAFAPAIWQAPLELNRNWSLQSITVDDVGFESGCAADFIGDKQYHWQSGILYINDTDGNPDDTGKTVTASIYDFENDNIFTMDVTGWSASPPAVWQAELSTEPIHVFVNDVLFDPNWWWGPLECEGQTGQEGFLYLRDAEANPDTNAKTVAAVVNTGGWAVTSGDFNGDGFADVVHSDAFAAKNKYPSSELETYLYINYGGPEFSASPGQILSRPVEQEGFGFFVASAGDVNNDGFDELIVALNWDVGAVYLYMGSESGLNNSPSLRLAAPGTVPAFGFGHGIAGNGNINGDDFSDILIMGGDGSLSYLCVYLGSAVGIRPEPDSVIEFRDKILGGSVCIPGDMNGDGFDEVALSMGAVPPVDSIEVRIFNGAADGILSNSRILELAIPPKEVYVHAEVAPAGDINSDGFADLLVGNQWAREAYENEGKSHIFLGSASGVSQAPDYTIDNPLPGNNVRFGASVSGIADMDRDGYADIAVGCPYGEDGQGFVSVYSGSATGMSNTPSQTIAGVNQFGWSVSAAGDLKGIEQAFLVAGEEFGGAYLYALPCDTLFYADADGDGYGDAGSATPYCIQHPGYVADQSDCNDADSTIHPDAVEMCNLLDDNCNGRIDEGCPLANAGADQEVTEGASVMLDGSGSHSTDPLGQIVAYLWTQVSGPAVTLSDTAAVSPTFVTPPVDTEGAVLVFELSIEDSAGRTGTDDVSVTVHDNGVTIFPADILTVVSATGQPVGIQVQEGASLVNIVAVDPAGLPAAVNPPENLTYGLFDMTIQVPAPGAAAEVLFLLPEPADQNQIWYHYYPDNGWTDFGEHAVFNDTRDRITISLVDGGESDDDLAANGTIRNLSGLGDNQDDDDDDGDDSDCFINTLK